MCEMEADSLSSRLSQSSSSSRIGTRSNRQHNDYRFATKPRYKRRIELHGYTLAEDELAQSVIYEENRQNQLDQLNQLNRTPFARGKKGQHQASMGVNGRHPSLLPDSDEEVWSDLTREPEIHGAVVDADHSDALSESLSETRHSPDRAQLTVMASNQDADIGGQQFRRASRRQSGSISPGRGQFFKQEFSSEPEHELDTKDEDEEKEDTDDDEEKRNSSSIQSDTDTDIIDTISANPVPPFTAPFAYLTVKAANKNESERFTEELRSGRGISESPSLFPVPPQTPGSETKCNFSYPRPGTAMKRGEHPYPSKVISHIFGRNKKVIQQIPPWI
ncbi:uncharacterized protein BDW70DRAFT_121180 [Aspergillus foveolatus]|uniref:uncharacterized protein n=1 Tax=Aspergillus foveolatus TaxID=210207 RepID=UPI003CCD795A